MTRRVWLLSGLGGAAVFLVARRALVAAPAKSRSSGKISTKFDSVFRRECPGLPVEYVRALAKHESDFNPLDTKGCCWGILQVDRGAVLSDYNKARKTTWTQDDLLDPSVNARIACDLILKIARGMVRNHPQTFDRIDFSNKNFVELLTFSWNAGWTESRGVGHVIGQLERRGEAVNLLSVRRAAIDLPRVSTQLHKKSKVGFAQRVTRTYFREIGQLAA